MIARENSSLRRRSGVRNAAANACSTCPPRVGRVRLAIGPPGTGAGRAEEGPRGPVSAPSRIPPRACEGWGGRGPLSDAGGAAPGRADLVGRGARERMRVHVHLDAAEVAGAEHLDRLGAAGRAGAGPAAPGVSSP